MIGRSRILAGAAYLLTLALAPSAAADDTHARCAEAFEKAQTERANGKYASAIAEAQTCSQLQCNVAVTRECVKLYETLKEEIPTLVFSARTEEGFELVAVRVLVDGQPLLEQIDGKPVSLDPGTHTFRFETEGYPPIEVSNTARVGDTNRLIEVVFSKPGQKKPAPAPLVAAPKTKKVPVASYILGGVGVAAIGFGTYLRISGVGDYNELNRECSPRCDEDEVEAIRTKFRISWVPIGAGAAAVVGAFVIYLVNPAESSAPRAALRVTPLSGGTHAGFSAQF